MPSQNAVESEPQGRTAWPLPLRIAFRFFFIYWLLYIIPSAGAVSIFDLLPFGGIGNTLKVWFEWPLGQLARVVGFDVFNLSIATQDWHVTGSGDTAMQYTLVFCIAVLAIVGTVLWSAIDERRRGRREYRTVYAWLRLALRITLAITLLGYGFGKVFPGQFGAGPNLAQLNETYGQSSPMHLLWFFMGFSRPYAIFGGLMEVIPGRTHNQLRRALKGLRVKVQTRSYRRTKLNLCESQPANDFLPGIRGESTTHPESSVQKSRIACVGADRHSSACHPLDNPGEIFNFGQAS